MSVKFKNFLLFVSDIIFFFILYYTLAHVLQRPLVIFTGSVLFGLYFVILWYFRFYNIEIYFNKISYISKIVKINIVVFILFWGTWWFLLKSQWPTVSRLLIISTIFVFGVIYITTVRLLLGNLLLKFSKIYLLLSNTHEKIFLQTISKKVSSFLKLKNTEDIKNEIKNGYLFISYLPNEKIKTRSEMWEDYLNQTKFIKENIKQKNVKAFVFNIYNTELQTDFSNVYLDNIPSIEIKSKNNRFYQKVLKKILDILLAILLIPVFIILHPLIYLLIRYNLGKPVIFKQLRVGNKMKPLKLLKYRTMSIVSGTNEQEVDITHRDYIESLLEEEETTHFVPDLISKVEKKIRKLKSREEIHLLGIILRKTSLDELPQIFNVLRGNMSFIGPRPALDYEVKMFPHWAMYRFDSPQGITGLWQILGRGLMPFHTSLFLDSYYTMEYSLWLDINIFLKTIKSVLNLSIAF